jgi:hypothetical protein
MRVIFVAGKEVYRTRIDDHYMGPKLAYEFLSTRSVIEFGKKYIDSKIDLSPTGSQISGYVFLPFP